MKRGQEVRIDAMIQAQPARHAQRVETIGRANRRGGAGNSGDVLVHKLVNRTTDAGGRVLHTRRNTLDARVRRAVGKHNAERDDGNDADEYEARD